MATLIGVVSKVVGDVFAVAGDGSRRALIEGDRLFAGEQLQTGAVGAVAVQLPNGHELTLGRDSSLSLSPQLLANQAPTVNAPEQITPSQAQLSNVEQLQKAIVAGVDPTQVAEATAAGPAGTTGTGALGGGHSFVLLTEVAGRVAPVIGFPTAGFGAVPEFPLFQVAAVDNGNDTGLVPVPPVEVPDQPVTLNGLTVEGGELTVNEAHLAQGSASDPAALVQSGTFSVSAPDGLLNLSVGGLSIVSGGVINGGVHSLTTALGNTLTITGYNAATGVVSYSYTLNGNQAHAPGGGANELSEHFSVIASDTDGDTASGSLDVNIIDDVPTAVDDSHSGSASESQLILTGNVLSNDVQGADRVASGPITGGTFTGQYGTLVLATDGSYTYTLNSADPDFVALQGGGNATETFAYTLTDADGDTSTAQLVLQVHNNDDPVLIDGISINGADLTLYEEHLANGSSPDASALTQVGSLTVSAADGLQSLSVGGIQIIAGGVATGLPQSIVTGLGNTLSITGYNAATGEITYSYTLLGNEMHPNANGANEVGESFNVVATDADGSSASAVLNVSIVDDLPVAHADTASVNEGDVVSGNVLWNDIGGADGPAASGAVVGVRVGSDTSTSAIGGLNAPIVGTYGYLTLDAAGNAVYHSTPDAVSPPGAVDTFVYTVRDADGDESTTTITIDVASNCLQAIADHDVTVYENALDLNQDGQDLAPASVVGSTPESTAETASGTLVDSVAGGNGTLTFSLVGSATGNYGQILLNADGTYTYTLTSAPKTSPGANDGPNVMTDSFVYKATDALGNTITNNIVVSIVDDVPQAVSSERSVTASQVDSNLLLIIDVSGSMNDPSGVGGASRLSLAKAAINELLNRYDDMGDVKVQIVTFNDSSQQLSSQWVDVATAKTLVAGISAADGTNYDSALGTAQAAYNSDGKLAGGQNVSYFFSDGNPTTSNTNNPNNPGNEVNPEYGDGIDTTEEGAWTAFLDANGIKSYAIGLGAGVNNVYLNPVAYDGSTHTDANAVVVTNLAGLDAVLSGTVQGAPVTGSLLADGTFGADGGFVKSLTVDGITYTYDPHALGNQGAVSANLPGGQGSFDTLSNSLTVTTSEGGTLVVNLDSGQFSYTPGPVAGATLTQTFGVTLSDNDGDLASANLVINVNPNAAPIAGADHVITNILSSSLVVPGELLLVNDSDANGDPLTASPTSFNTGWQAKGASFVGSGSRAFTNHGNTAANQNLADVRASFAADAPSMTAVLVVSGYLGNVTPANANDEDLITVSLKQGETLNLDHNLLAGHIALEYSLNGGAFVSIADGDTLTATADGVYQIHISNLTNPSGSNANGAENYQLTMTLNYAGAQDLTPDYHGNYTVNDNHGGSDSAGLSISYQDGHTLTGTAGDDILMAGPGDNILNGGDGNDVLSAGSGNNQLHGGNGNDLLFSGAGNDLLDGGAGNDVVSYAHATAGVSVDLSLLVAQNTVGAGTDTLLAVENLVGSNFNDSLTGDQHNNSLFGGLGNDSLNGGDGNDLLNGGLGNNTLSGGAGADTFQYSAGNSGHDVISDFAPGTDTLDLAQLLQGENATAASLDDYLHFNVTGSGGSLVTTLDISAVAGAAPTQSIDLAGVDLATHYGVTPGAGGMIAAGADTATIINGMLNDHSLKVDTV